MDFELPSLILLDEEMRERILKNFPHLSKQSQLKILRLLNHMNDYENAALGLAVTDQELLQKLDEEWT